ncbi:MAG: hypothetical protein AAF226_03400 [Verrucomicrobiota bacterium]
MDSEWWQKYSSEIPGVNRIEQSLASLQESPTPDDGNVVDEGVGSAAYYLQQENLNQQRELDHLRKLVQALEADKEWLQRRLESEDGAAGRVVDQFQREALAINHQLDVLNLQVKEREAETKVLREKVEFHSTNETSLSAKVDKLTGELESEKTEHIETRERLVADATKERCELSDKIESQRDRFEQKIDDQKTQFETDLEKIETQLKGEISSLESTLKTVDEKHDEKVSELKSTHKKIEDKSSAELKELKANVSSLESRRDDLESSLETAEKKLISEAKAHKVKLREECERAREESADETRDELMAIFKSEWGHRRRKTAFFAFLLCSFLGLAVLVGLYFGYWAIVPEKPVQGMVAKVIHEVPAKFSGTLEKLNHAKSTRVTEGQELAVIKTDQLKSQVDSLKAAKIEAETALSNDRISLDSLRRERLVVSKQLSEWKLLREGLSGSPQADQAVANDIASLEPEYIELDAKVKKLEARLESVESNSENARLAYLKFLSENGITDGDDDGQTTSLQLVSPVNGFIADITQNVGSTVESGGLLITVAARPTYLEIPVPKETFDDMKIGQTIWVRAEAGVNPTFPLQVLRKEVVLDDQETHIVHLNFPSGSAWTPGQAVFAHFRDPEAGVKAQLHGWASDLPGIGRFFRDSE